VSISGKNDSRRTLKLEQMENLMGRAVLGAEIIPLRALKTLQSTKSQKLWGSRSGPVEVSAFGAFWCRTV